MDNILNLKLHVDQGLTTHQLIDVIKQLPRRDLIEANLFFNIHNYKNQHKIMTTIDDALAEIGQLKTQVARNNEILAKLAEQAKAAGTDSEKLQALSDSILSITKDLTDADNTAAPAPAAEVTA